MGPSRRATLQITGAANLVFRPVSPFLPAGNTEQDFGGDAACCARSLHLVEARKCPLARCRNTRPIRSYFSRRQRVDDLGTEISCARSWSGLDPNISRTSDHRG